jgi:uncharacterized membrane protein YedE/YeeE
MKIITALVAGLVFGIGLILSGMTDPSKVIGFLDLAGNWNPSLALVMGGAIGVGLVAFRFATRQPMTLLGDPLHLPVSSQIDRRLVLGGLTFGAGWGLAGYCPGPALASLLTGSSKPVIFVLAMLAGMGIFELLERRAVASRVAA